MQEASRLFESKVTESAIQLPHSEALCSLQFGVPLYGATLLGEVVYKPDNANGCARFATSLTGKQADLPAVALVNRGGEALSRGSAC